MEQNEMKINTDREMKITVCEMTIYFLATSYSDILNRKLKKKSVSPEKFRLGGMRDAFVATYKVQRRFCVTDSNRKQGLYPFYKP